jgi:hypothetical protein
MNEEDTFTWVLGLTLWRFEIFKKMKRSCLIDYYGAVWKQAWQEHVHSFVPRENYVPAYGLNEMSDITYRTA